MNTDDFIQHVKDMVGALEALSQDDIDKLLPRIIDEVYGKTCNCYISLFKKARKENKTNEIVFLAALMMLRTYLVMSNYKYSEIAKFYDGHTLDFKGDYDRYDD